MKARIFSAGKFGLATILVPLFCFVFPAAAQEITGTIVGTVFDPQSRVVPGAAVTLTNTDKGIVVAKVTTNDQGDYVATLLPIGHYSVTVEVAGFKKSTRTGVELNVSDHLTINFTLEAGSISEIIDVKGDVLEVDLQTSEAAGLITGTQVRELALNNRNYVQLAALMPGVTTGFASDQIEIGVTSFTGLSNQVNVSINGNRPTQNNWTIDGADNVDRGANLTLLDNPSVDSIAEFKVLRGQYDPENGRSSSGEINVITRSGESTFHGGLYEFFRNDVLNGNNFFNNANGIARPPLRYNNFGGTIGGPLFIPGVYNTDHKKTFFFFSEEVRRIKTFSTFVGTVPSMAERAGTFPTPVCTAVSGTICTAQTTQITTIDPAAAAYIKDIFSKLPQPQDLVKDTLTSVGGNTFNHRQEILRIDHVVNSKLSLFGRFMNEAIPSVEPGGLFTGDALPGVSTTSTNSPGRGFTARATMTLSPNLINEPGYAYSYGAVVSNPTGLEATANSPDIVAAVTLPLKSTIVRVPDLTFGGQVTGDISAVSGFGPYRDYNRNHNVFDTLTWIKGQHTLKFGGTLNLYQKSENHAGGNNGSFNFTDAPVPTGTPLFRQEWANFLLGDVSSFTQLSQDFHAEVRQHQFEAFAQDAFRVLPNLTLTYGIRYSYFGQPTDAGGQATSFDTALYNPAKAPAISFATGQITSAAGTFDPLNGVIVGGKNSPFGNAVANQHADLFAPRVGFAWDPFKTGKTSIRAGYGIFYDSPAINSLEQFQFSNPPFVQNITISNTTLDNPGAVAPNLNLLPPFLGGPSADWKQPSTQQWSLDVQRELPSGVVLDVGYYGNAGTHLIGIVDINEAQPGAAVAAGIVAPGQAVGSGLTTQRLNFIRPFQGYDAINLFKTIFTSNYNSLQTSVQKRFRGNSEISMNYTYSHGLTTAQSDFTAPQNSYNIAADYGPDRFDRRHVFNANFIYELPWLQAQKGWEGHLLGGWEISGIVYAFSGLPLTVTASRDPAGLGLRDGNSFAGGRPNQVGDPNANAPHTVGQWFNTSAFVFVPTGSNLPGNAPRGAVIGPGDQRWDLSLFKNIRITERTTLQFRSEAINVFNHTNFNTVSTSRTSGLYGQVLSARDPRIMQLALKLSF
jgi:hypothetical protein